MNALYGSALPSAAEEALLPDLWATLFLVVPLVSTTFASVGRMFGRFPPQSLGWLSIDEAGQALPEVVRLLRSLAAAEVPLDLYVVTPFVIVADNLRRVIRESGVLRSILPEDDIWKWTIERVGTVHTVQGREAEAVIFVLGAPKPMQTGARGWAGGRPNLLNVAVTRAKEALYVIGNRELWHEAGHFRRITHVSRRSAQFLLLTSSAALSRWCAGRWRSR